MAYLPWWEGSSPTSDARWLLAAVGEEEGCGMLTLTLVRQAQRCASSKLQEGITKVCESTCGSWDNSAVPCNILISWEGPREQPLATFMAMGGFSPPRQLSKRKLVRLPRVGLCWGSAACVEPSVRVQGCLAMGVGSRVQLVAGGKARDLEWELEGGGVSESWRAGQSMERKGLWTSRAMRATGTLIDPID